MRKKMVFVCIFSVFFLTGCGLLNADTEPPVITLNGDAVITLEVGNTFKDLGAEATDNYDKDLEVTVSGDVDVNKVGDYTYKYNVEDKKGNAAEEVIRVVKVVDKIVPEIELIGKPIITVKVGRTYKEFGAEATDNYDKDLEVIRLGDVDVDVPGQYIVKYSVTDSSGNSAEISREVNIIDETAPIISLNGNSMVTLIVGSEYTELGANVFDNFDEDLEVVISGDVDVNSIGKYIVKYDVTDSSGNSATQQERVVNIIEVPIDIVINQRLLPTDHIKVGYSMDPTYIVIHNTANRVSAKNEVAWLYSSENTSSTSYHFAVDESEIWQAVDTSYNAWHAGDGSSVRSYNRNSIGIEIARSTHTDIQLRDDATHHAAMLTAKLMREHNIPIENVVRHYDASGKKCPHDIMDRYGWENYLALVESFL